jgi:hypothetical protein
MNEIRMTTMPRQSSELPHMDGANGTRPNGANYFREMIGNLRPRSTQTDIDAAISACWTKLDRREIPDKLKECVLIHLDADLEQTAPGPFGQ